MLPQWYDGYIAFELPPCGTRFAMFGMEQKHDGHVCGQNMSYVGVTIFWSCSV